MFRLGIMTDEISEDFAHALAVIEELGVRVIELHSLWEKNICELESHELGRALRLVQQRGFHVSDIATLFLRCPLDDDDAYDQHMRMLERGFRIAELFDTPLVRCFSGWRTETPFQQWDLLLERLTLPVRMAERAGITLAFENVRSCHIGTGAETARLMELVDSPSLRVIWDPANALVSGERQPYPDGYERVKPWIVHVHVKDARVEPDGSFRWLPIGEGQVDYAGQLQALARDGYTGVVSLETHYQPADGTREQGSRESFHGLQTILRKLGLRPE